MSDYESVCDERRELEESLRQLVNVVGSTDHRAVETALARARKILCEPDSVVESAFQHRERYAKTRCPHPECDVCRVVHGQRPSEALSVEEAHAIAGVDKYDLWCQLGQCEDVSPDNRNACTCPQGHPGAHVAVDPVFNRVLDAWPAKSVPRTNEASPDKMLYDLLEALGGGKCSWSEAIAIVRMMRDERCSDKPVPERHACPAYGRHPCTECGPTAKAAYDAGVDVGFAIGIAESHDHGELRQRLNDLVAASSATKGLKDKEVRRGEVASEGAVALEVTGPPPGQRSETASPLAGARIREYEAGCRIVAQDPNVARDTITIGVVVDRARHADVLGYLASLAGASVYEHCTGCLAEGPARNDCPSLGCKMLDGRHGGKHHG